MDSLQRERPAPDDGGRPSEKSPGKDTAEGTRSGDVVEGPWPAKRPNWWKFDAEYQHQWTQFRPFLMDRVESHLRRTPASCRWAMYLLLQRVSDEGLWRGRRVTLAGILGVPAGTMRRHMHDMKEAGVLTYNFRGDGEGWVRVTGFAGLLRHSKDE